MDPRATERHLDASRLESLLESARLLSSSLHLDDQLRHLMRTIMGRLLITRAVIALYDAGTSTLRVALSRGVPGLKPGAVFDAAESTTYQLPHSTPIGDPAQPLGILAVGAPARGKLDQAEREFLSALLSLAAASISNARDHDSVIRANRALDQNIQELRALLDLVRGLAATIDPEEVTQLLMLTLSGRWAVRRHALFTWKPNQPPIARVKGLDHWDLDAWRQKLEGADTPQRDGEFVLFPIPSGDTTTGLVALGPRPGNLPFTPADLEFGMGLIAQASVALDNAWHFRDTLVRQQLEKELTLAASIQLDLFPKFLPTLVHTDLAARNRQARQVGGDYYDAIPIGAPSPEATHLLCVADISGKGIAASLLMANIQATLRALLAAHPSTIELAVRSNDLLWSSTPNNKYATALFVRYDPVTGACEYVNGGHCDGIVLRACGEVEMLGTTGMPIGLFPKREYECASFVLHAGDTLLLYSDGVPDACTPDDREFSVERSIDVLRANAHRAAAEIQDALFAAIDAFVEGAPQFDDITVMVIRRTS
jgi:sigma-B regulation protein RsbU (phosphoserine phosphatase)